MLPRAETAETATVDWLAVVNVARARDGEFGAREDDAMLCLAVPLAIHTCPVCTYIKRWVGVGVGVGVDVGLDVGEGEGGDSTHRAKALQRLLRSSEANLTSRFCTVNMYAVPVHLCAAPR